MNILNSEAIIGHLHHLHHLHEAILVLPSMLSIRRTQTRDNRFNHHLQAPTRDQDKYSHIYICIQQIIAAIQPPRPPSSRPARVPAPQRSISISTPTCSPPACPTRHASLHHRQGSASRRIHGGSASPRVDWLFAARVAVASAFRDSLAAESRVKYLDEGLRAGWGLRFFVRVEARVSRRPVFYCLACVFAELTRISLSLSPFFALQLHIDFCHGFLHPSLQQLPLHPL